VSNLILLSGDSLSLKYSKSTASLLTTDIIGKKSKLNYTPSTNKISFYKSASSDTMLSCWKILPENEKKLRRKVEFKISLYASVYHCRMRLRKG